MDKMMEAKTVFYATLKGNQHKVEIEKHNDSYQITVDGKPYTVDARFVNSPNTLSLIINMKCYEVTVRNSGKVVHVSTGGEEFELELTSLREQAARRPEPTIVAHKEIRAPMPGIILSVEVEENDTVEAGQPLLVIEAMKMQNEIASPGKARVSRVFVSPGDVVESKQTLIALDLL